MTFNIYTYLGGPAYSDGELKKISEHINLSGKGDKKITARFVHFLHGLEELSEAEERAHILEGLKIAQENIDETIKLIKRSSDPNEAKQELIKKFSLSERQAKAILDMRLQRLTSLEVDKIVSTIPLEELGNLYINSSNDI